MSEKVKRAIIIALIAIAYIIVLIYWVRCYW